MKRIQAAALIAVLSAAAHVQADELAAYPGPVSAGIATPAVSTAAVPTGDAAAYPGIAPVATGLTRAEVMADVEAARRVGALPTNEAGLAPMGAPRARAVRMAVSR